MLKIHIVSSDEIKTRENNVLIKQENQQLILKRFKCYLKTFRLLLFWVLTGHSGTLQLNFTEVVLNPPASVSGSSLWLRVLTLGSCDTEQPPCVKPAAAVKSLEANPPVVHAGPVDHRTELDSVEEAVLFVQYKQNNYIK